MYWFRPQKARFTSDLMGRTAIDITQLGCTPLAGICLPGISCTFACHNKFIYVCALRTAYSLPQWLNFHILSLQYAECPTRPAHHWCFRDDGLTSSHIFFSEQETKYASVYLHEDPNHRWRLELLQAMWFLSDLQWFILVTLESNISKNELNELGGSGHILSM